MRIAQVSPLAERVPPPGYGGIELVVGLLTDELVRRGHEVTLFASGDSITKAKLEAVYPKALRLDPTVKEPAVYDMLQLQRIFERSHEFDVIHFHNGYSALPLAELMKTAVVHTLHGNFTADSRKLYQQYPNQGYISISDAQREGGPELNYVNTVYNGIAIDDYPFFEKPQDPPYLAFLGRISPEKGIHHAIEIAKQTGWHLKIAGKVDPVDRKFYENEIAPLINGKQIEYLGETTHQEKVEVIGNAIATLFPITWREPFGLVMIESMCVGTPLIAMNLGSVPEIVVHGKTGTICNSIEEAIASIPTAIGLDRKTCRDYAISKFSIAKMVDGYEAAYRKVLAASMERNGHVKEPMILV